MNPEFRLLLALAKKHHFFSPEFSKNSKNVLSYCFGPSGSLFRENIKLEWIHSSITKRDTSMYLFTKADLTTDDSTYYYTSVRDICNKQLPFGYAQVYTKRVEETESKLEINESSYFSSCVKTMMCTEMFVSPNEGMQHFFQAQRERKLWWKKISASPSRFSLGEVHKSSDKTLVNIIANFGWGNEIFETISVGELDERNDVDMKARCGRKVVTPMVVASEMSLETAVIGLLCDAYDKDRKRKLPALRIHKKLTPFKCIFAASGPDSETLEELAQLAFFLTKQLRKSGISTALLPDCTASPLSSQFQRNDEWGIPFTVIVDPETLKSGIVDIRNRDTSVREEVHVSDLIQYLERLYRRF